MEGNNIELPPVTEEEKKELVLWLEQEAGILDDHPHLDHQHEVGAIVPSSPSTTEERLRAFLHQLQGLQLSAADEFVLLMTSSVVLIMLGYTEISVDLPQRAWTLLIHAMQQQQQQQQQQMEAAIPAR